MDSRIRIYQAIQAIQAILSVPLKCILSAVIELQIGPILCFLGVTPSLVDCVDNLLWHGVLSNFVAFEDATSFQTE